MKRAGFVLVGGNSSRMGRDKALLPYGGVCLAEHVAAQVREAAGTATLVGRPDRYRGLNLPIIADSTSGYGPVAGIEAALAFTSADWNLIVACDMPQITAGFLTVLFEQAERHDAACLIPVPPCGRPEPLCAVYHRRCLAAFRSAIQAGVHKLTRAAELAGGVFLPVPDSRAFENLNTPEDWAAHRPGSEEVTA